MLERKFTKIGGQVVNGPSAPRRGRAPTQLYSAALRQRRTGSGVVGRQS
eukprot:COSAG03_NODE_9909_length_686_cov_1.522998_1_plen_48_part_10